jgi:hypothetical protein
MKKITLICDICESAAMVRSFRINDGRSIDPSGNGYNVDWIYKDYCPICLFTVKNSDVSLEILEI